MQVKNLSRHRNDPKQRATKALFLQPRINVARHSQKALVIYSVPSIDKRSTAAGLAENVLHHFAQAKQPHPKIIAVSFKGFKTIFSKMILCQKMPCRNPEQNSKPKNQDLQLFIAFLQFVIQHQWLFLVYKWHFSCQLGDYMPPTYHLLGEPKITIDNRTPGHPSILHPRPKALK